MHEGAMETFKFILFGLAGASIIFWVFVISLWLTTIYPKLFSEDRKIEILPEFTSSNEIIGDNPNPSFMKEGALRPIIKYSTLRDRSKYSRKYFVVADFSIGESDYPNNRLYTLLLISLGVMSFTVVSYGLMPSGISFLGISM